MLSDLSLQYCMSFLSRGSVGSWFGGSTSFVSTSNSGLVNFVLVDVDSVSGVEARLFIDDSLMRDLFHNLLCQIFLKLL